MVKVVGGPLPTGEDGAAAALTSILRVHRRNKNPRALGVRVGGPADLCVLDYDPFSPEVERLAEAEAEA